MDFINQKIVEKINKSKKNNCFYYNLYLLKNESSYLNNIEIYFEEFKRSKRISMGDSICLLNVIYTFEGLIKKENNYSILLRKEKNYYEFEINKEDDYFLKVLYEQSEKKETNGNKNIVNFSIV